MSTRARSLTVVLLILAACGDNTETPPGDAGVDGSGSQTECTVAGDCDDHDACTTDTCNANHECENAPKVVDDSIPCTVDACNTTTGEVMHMPVDAMCEADGKSCTVATCSATTGCSETPTVSVCDDDATCSTDACDPTATGADPTTGCTHTPDNTACTDTFSCTTNTCSPGATGADATTGCLVTPDNTACGDSIACTTDTCNPSGSGAGADGCVHQTDDTMCELDGKSCTVAACSATTGCSETAMDTLCNDNATCSTDTCSPTGPGATGCVYTLNDTMCADTAECSIDACAPGTSGADPTTGCAYAADATACDDNASCSSAFDCTCDIGFTGNGLTCAAVMCDPLTDPTNGTISISNGGLYPSTATYACSSGFELVGSTPRTCNPDGTWSGTAPTCRAITFFVLRIGDGAAPLGAISTAVFLEERDLTGAVVRTIPLPTTANGAQAAFTLQGTATAEGGLSRSSDGRYLVLGGYAATTGIANINDTVNRMTDATPTNRVIARVASDGTVDTSTLLLHAFSANSIRGASSADGTGFWATGTSSGTPATGGVHYVPFGNTGATTIVSTTQNNLRHTHVFGSQLYTSSGAGTATRGVMAVGTGLPTTSGETSTPVVTLPGSLAANSFAVLDLDVAVPGVDTVYIAFDSGGAVGTVNLQKWTFDGTTWSQATFAPTVSGTVTPLTLGLTTWLDGSVVHIIVTTNESGTSRLLDIVDDGVTTAPAATVLATSATNTAFRGLARSPLP